MLGDPRLVILLLFLLCSSDARGQRIAVLAPDSNAVADRIAYQLSDQLSKNLTLVDSSLASTAFLAVGIENPFNLSLDEAKRAGSAIGSDAFILVKAETLRRTSSARSVYYESYAAFFLVRARSGHLICWRLVKSEADTAAKADKRLDELVERLAAEIRDNCKAWLVSDGTAERDAEFPEMPADNSPDAKNFRAPIPYLRIKPEYTKLAFLYDVKGTVEITVDLDEKGTIIRTEIARWAGFGLDESVIDAVRKMNWRPAERGGNPLPMRFLLRYNFKKIDKEQL